METNPPRLRGVVAAPLSPHKDGLPVKKSSPNKDRIRKNDPLGEFLVFWNDFTEADRKAFRSTLSRAEREEDIQRFLSKNPMLLARQLRGGHGRWVIPKLRLGSQHVTDFLLGEKSSVGYEWHAVELESPRAKMFTIGGDPTQALTHAIRQIQDWRAWLQKNQNYAARSKSESGLGLTDIVSTLPGLILIGRREDIPEHTRELRQQMNHDLNIRIHSYDYFCD
jgi:hypothetical protein